MKDEKKLTFNNAINQIKKLGFSVYIPKDGEHSTYGHFSDRKDVGYFQVNDLFLDTIQLASVHKPNIKIGAGFQVIEHIKPIDLKKGDLLEVLHFTPKYDYGDNIKKYTIEDWIENSWSGQRSKKV